MPLLLYLQNVADYGLRRLKLNLTSPAHRHPRTGHLVYLGALGTMALVAGLLALSVWAGVSPKLGHSQILFPDEQQVPGETMGAGGRAYLVLGNGVCTTRYRAGPAAGDGCGEGQELPACPVEFDYGTAGPLSCPTAASAAYAADFDIVQVLAKTGLRTESSSTCRADSKEYKKLAKRFQGLALALAVLGGAFTAICAFLALYPDLYPSFLPPLGVQISLLLVSLAGLVLSYCLHRTHSSLGDALASTLASCLSLTPPGTLVVQQGNGVVTVNSASVANFVLQCLGVQYAAQYVFGGVREREESEEEDVDEKYGYYYLGPRPENRKRGAVRSDTKDEKQN